MIKLVKSTNGITLVALVVTIVVLIILATISISIIFDEDGIMKKARQTKEYQVNADAQWSETTANLISYIHDAINGSVTTETPENPEIPENPTIKEELTAEMISFTPEDTNWEVENVKQALDYLYNN